MACWHQPSSRPTAKLDFLGSTRLWQNNLARLLAEAVGLQPVQLSAVLAGVQDVRKAVSTAQDLRQLSGQGTLLFIDEIHRFQKRNKMPCHRMSSQGFWLWGVTTETLVFR